MKTDLRNTSIFMVTGLVVGHAVFHWIIQSFVVLLPEIQQTFGLSAVAIGGLLASRELSSGIRCFSHRDIRSICLSVIGHCFDLNGSFSMAPAVIRLTLLSFPCPQRFGPLISWSGR